MNKLPWPRVRLVVGFCLGLFLVNAVWLMYLAHSDRSQLHSNPFYQTYLNLRSVALRPFSLAVMLLWIAYGFFWVFKPRKKPARELERLGVLAMMLSALLGLLLALLFKPL